MGNNPSSQSKSASSSQSQPHHTLSVHHHNHQRRDHDREDPSSRPTSVKREVKHPIPLSHNTAAPPEPSLAQAQGTTIAGNNNSNNSSTVSRGRSLRQQHNNNNTSSTSTTPGSSVTSATAKPVDAKPRPDARRDREEYEPAKPIAVHSSDVSSSENQSSPFPEPGAEAAMLPHVHSSVQDVSYLTRPPRLPLPIDQEIQAPGSPILAPADLGGSVEDLDALDPESVIARRASGLSGTTLDEDDDVEELRVDKNRPTVPLKLEWFHGGTKVYVTGTIFEWNRKIRMAPM
jgi:hypothetical protein